MKKEFTANDFRGELKKVLPGYKWTVSRSKWATEHMAEIQRKLEAESHGQPDRRGLEMTTCLTIFDLLIICFWGLFLYWTAHPSPKPREESRYEVLEESGAIEEQEPHQYTSDELKAMMGKRDPFNTMR